MKAILGIAILATLLVVAAFGRESDQGFAALFNGKDLTGWTPTANDAKWWSVKDGAIVGRAPDGIKYNAFLATKETYSDFELRLSVRLKPDTGNSGIQFRSFIRPDGHVAGYQADVGRNVWGSLYEETLRGTLAGYDGARVEPKLRKEDWNEYVIRCEGDHITLMLNGVVTADLRDAQGRRDGIIALQIHAGPAIEVAFRDIRLQRLNKEGVTIQPISLHPANRHYFLHRGRPAVLISSAEHYGAVLNLDFDYVKYLDTLHRDRLNLTRTFTGSYVEHSGAFKIAENTLAPGPERFACPWLRSDIPGYANGGNRFDLTKWDDAYFARLRDFVAQAGKRGVIVELCFFCPFYSDAQWNLSPQNAANNINGPGNVARSDVYTLDRHGGLLPVHEALVRKIVNELKDADNVIYEICNEPYFGGVTMAWQQRIADVVVDAEKTFAHKHLITQNIANGRAQIANPHPAVSVFNFHYATPPDTVAMNYALDKVIGDNETGFKGTGDTHYRMEGWEFILAGGALYNNLDYSFTAGHEDGTFAYPPTQPGGGTPALRKQLRVLKDLIHSFDFVRMRPEPSIVKAGLGERMRARALVETGKQYAVYVFGGHQVELTLEIPAGKYRAEWVNTLTASIDKRETVSHAGGNVRLTSPPYEQDVALRIVRSH